MKKLLYLVGVSLLLPTASPAQAAQSLLDDGSAFQVAAAVKLGRITDNSNGTVDVKSAVLDGTKELDEADPCATTTCPNKTPTCVVENKTAVCKCTSTSCGDGATCQTNGTCKNCAAGEQCNCPSGKYADGNGACETINYCAGNPCASRPTTPLCVSDQRLYDRNGTGFACGCSSNPDSCGAGNKCSVPCDALNMTCVTNPLNAVILTYNCLPCSDGDTTCGCPTGQVADGVGGCRAACTKGQTDCSLCAAGQVYDGSKCRNPCEGVTCPLLHSCVAGDGKGCCVMELQQAACLISNCETCNTSGTSCVTCKTGYTLSNGTCVEETSCPTNCATCSSSTCTKCNSGYLLTVSGCSSCPANATCTGTSTFTCDPGYTKSGAIRCVKSTSSPVCNGTSAIPVSCPSGQTLIANRGCCTATQLANPSMQCYQCAVNTPAL